MLDANKTVVRLEITTVTDICCINLPYKEAL